MAENVLNFLFSSAKLERDKGVLELENLLRHGNENIVTTLENEFLKTLESQELKWETKHGCLIGSKVLITQSNCDNSPVFLNDIQNYSLMLLEDGESRVRLAAGKCHVGRKKGNFHILKKKKKVPGTTRWIFCK